MEPAVRCGRCRRRAAAATGNASSDYRLLRHHSPRISPTGYVTDDDRDDDNEVMIDVSDKAGNDDDDGEEIEVKVF
jgi:hypothetical protein